MEKLEDDYPSQLLRQRDGDDSRATIRDIIAVTFNLLFAGHETTSSASANILSSILSQRALWDGVVDRRSEEHTSELQSLMRNSYAVFCLKKQPTNSTHNITTLHKT